MKTVKYIWNSFVVKAKAFWYNLPDREKELIEGVIIGIIFSLPFFVAILLNR